MSCNLSQTAHIAPQTSLSNDEHTRLCSDPTILSQLTPSATSASTSTSSTYPNSPDAPTMPTMAGNQGPFGGSSAPMPSPSAASAAAQSANYFATHHSGRQYLSAPQVVPAQRHDSTSTISSGASGNGGTADYLKDFSLIAEAAKRAQVAVVTRDLEDISL